MVRNSVIEFCIRLAVFACAAVAYFSGWDIAGMVLGGGFPGALVLAVWLIMLAGMVLQFFPRSKFGMGNNKQFQDSYLPPAAGYDAVKLRVETVRMNRGARNVLLFWLAVASFVVVMFLCGLIGANEVLLVVAAFYVGDGFCMLAWCPLQTFFMERACCANCRIYGWGSFFVFALLLLLPGVYTYTLAFLSLALLVRWEIVFARNPERFWKGSNDALQCGNCTDKNCTFQRKIIAKHAKSFKEIIQSIRERS